MLNSFFRENPRFALCFSGGTDSSYLLYAALKAGVQVHAYYAYTELQPEFETEDAKRLAGDLGAPLTIIRYSVLSLREVSENGPLRCYFCKRAILREIRSAALKDGFSVLADGCNASDDPADRPGMRAAAEFEVRSPLREAGLTKAEVRRLSREAGLFTADKPAYSCLATRLVGVGLDAALLGRVERGENKLMALGFTDFRLRTDGVGAFLELPAGQLEKAEGMKDRLQTLLGNDFSGLSLRIRKKSE
ncbi:MAG: ATP-dependent sacrificial sulfur transferase LarE [Clostridiales bacterium]|nr:ATP-dependent sacrificial sulfur transferase LarE [Clostridiales bacterium]